MKLHGITFLMFWAIAIGAILILCAGCADPDSLRQQLRLNLFRQCLQTQAIWAKDCDEISKSIAEETYP